MPESGNFKPAKSGNFSPALTNTSWLNNLQDNNLEKFCNIDGKYVFYNHFKEFFIPIINFKNAEKIERKRLEEEAREAKRREEEKSLLKLKELEQQKKMEAQEKENKRVSNLLSELDSI